MADSSESHELPPSSKASSKAGRDLPAAVAVGAVLFVIVAAAMIWWPPGVVLLVVLLAVLGTTEVVHALRRVGLRASIVPVALGAAVIVLAGYAGALWPGGVWGTVRWAVIGGAVLLCLIWRMAAGPENYARDAAADIFTVGYVGVLLSFVGPIIALPDGNWKLITVFCCTVASDTGGYILGATLGKHAMAPKISPKKTWEGMAGSVVLSAIVGVLLAVFALHEPWWFGVGLGVVMVVFGTLGDLVESLIKRDVGIKDMSSVLPGHGGIMERLDSMIVAMPVGWLIFSLPL